MHTITAPYAYALFLLLGIAGIGAVIGIDRWSWRRQQRREVDTTWQSFTDGRWRK